ncbi:hypothetical protein RIF25_15190 [Thermosynechococcaceae cyanobacterium BACA0444]|uniref:Uncharacterized protein n=1 Tax=Pseudocalidococcus azoricus BACA0444 TaxID=2918990 RepID=A0AAE4FTU4_9CYAN|nr:hypothetical protein [Pseudocalidococcus azoricus]MDS3862145.1 hypothetical protein [Pseudocalidococcus azoricus BACA0444]
MLTELAIPKAKAIEKTQKLFDGDGLYLEVPKKGGLTMAAQVSLRG